MEGSKGLEFEAKTEGDAADVAEARRGRDRQLKADFMLLAVTLCWGTSYYFVDLSLEELDPFTLNALRFLGGFLLAAALSWKRVKNVNFETLKCSLMVALSLMVVYIGATFGLKYTSLSNSGFLCALTVVFTPILERFVLKKKAPRKLVAVVLMCLVGIALLTLNNDFSINKDNLKGDLLCIMCAVAYAVDLLITESSVKKENVDPYQLGAYSLGITGLLNLVMAFIVEKPVWPQTAPVWGYVAFLAFFCTGFAFVIQPIAQQYTTASHTGVIFAAEPVFAAIVAVIFAGEILSKRAYFGAALMVLSIVYMELDLGKKVRRKAGAADGEDRGGGDGDGAFKGYVKGDADDDVNEGIGCIRE